MEVIAIPKPVALLKSIGIKVNDIHYQLSQECLTQQTLKLNQGVLDSHGALCVNTGKFTGRNPQDKYLVEDDITKSIVDWKGSFNNPISETVFKRLKEKVANYLSSKKEVWVRDCIACATPQHQLKIRVVNEDPWSNLFAYNMFITPEDEVIEKGFNPDWHILQAPGFLADPITDGVRSPHFAIISAKHKMIIIGGTGYTGEIKKGIFTVLNLLLPSQDNILSMHCSANVGNDGDVALFFGLSGTGKTTLSADPNRQLIGDDEHGWDAEGIFNFEGGCYAKCIGLSKEKEPEIFAAVKPGALLENITFKPGTNEVDFNDGSITENTRVSYPLSYINNALIPSYAGHPKNIFFLTCDANGVLPPISRLTPGQAMYQFISGYTAKVAGTEHGVTEPKSTFSACFGAPFMPLHPGKYAKMLGELMRKHKVNVWLVNTGWIGGSYGIGNRISLKYTRSLITAALNGDLDKEEYGITRFFRLSYPKACPNVPSEILNPRDAWKNPEEFDAKAADLAAQYIKNFVKFETEVDEEIKKSAPLTQV